MSQRPLVEGEHTKLLNFRVPESFIDVVHAADKERGVTKSTLLREALRQYLDEQEDAA